jgi:excisionase family DNA binding protein
VGGRVNDQTERLLKPAEVAERLAVSRSWVYDAADDGRLPAVRLGGPSGPLRFVARDLEGWIEEARRDWHPCDSRREVLRRVQRRAA